MDPKITTFMGKVILDMMTVHRIWGYRYLASQCSNTFFFSARAHDLLSEQHGTANLRGSRDVQRVVGHFDPYSHQTFATLVFSADICRSFESWYRYHEG